MHKVDECVQEEILQSQPVQHQDTIGYSTAIHLDDVDSTPQKQQTFNSRFLSQS